MKFLVILVALLAEQVRPLRRNNFVNAAFARLAEVLEKHFNGGQYRHGMVAWLSTVLPLVLATMLIHFLLGLVSTFAAWVWAFAVLYVTMGFRQFSHHFSEIMQALRKGDPVEARRELTQWINEPADEFTASEIAGVAIERGLIDSHRSVFGPVAWFLVLGPAGALLYRVAVVINEQWQARIDPELGEFGRFATRALFWIDWLPARMSALSFAIVGNFEDAIYCWRTQVATWLAPARNVLLASGGGALGVRLGEALHQYGRVQYRPEMGMGESAEPDHMQSAVGLIWRALVLWMFLLFLVTLAHSLG
jgi:adenosylcobinamide-phosphate synthase